MELWLRACHKAIALVTIVEETRQVHNFFYQTLLPTGFAGKLSMGIVTSKRRNTAVTQSGSKTTDIIYKEQSNEKNCELATK